MQNLFLDLPLSVRVVSYFGPRENVMSRVADVMQTGQVLYLACHTRLTDRYALNEELGVAALADLDEVAYLILDDCDRLDSKTLICLVRTLVQETQSVKLILFGRRPLIDLYEDLIIAPLYQCYVGSVLIESPYRREDAHVVLYVEAFGRGRAFANGHLIKNWNGPQQIETFFVMLDLMPAAPDTLLLALFESTSDEAYSRFHVSKTYINRALAEDFTTLGWGAQARQQAYYLSNKITLHSDVYTFGMLIKQMFDQTATQDTILAAALELMQFPFQEYVAQIVSNAHIKGRRLQVRYYLSQALVQVGYHIWRQGDEIQAEALLSRATIIDRANREAVDALMALYQQQGDAQSAAAVYRRWHDAQQDTGV